MSVEWNMVKDFWDYVEMYPDEDEPDFDGVHYGGIKGLTANAPDHARKAYAEYNKMLKKAQENKQKF